MTKWSKENWLFFGLFPMGIIGAYLALYIITIYQGVI